MRFLKLLTVLLFAGAFIAMLAVLSAGVCFDGADSYTFFCGDGSKNCRAVTTGGNAALKKLTLRNVCGESAEYREFDFDGYLELVDGEIVFVEELSDSVNYYCKANLPYSVTLYGEEINLHICVRSDSVKIASPIIFGGY